MTPRPPPLTVYSCPDHPHVCWLDTPEEGYTYCPQCDRDRSDDARAVRYVPVDGTPIAVAEVEAILREYAEEADATWAYYYRAIADQLERDFPF